MAQREGEPVLLAEEKMEFLILTWLRNEQLIQGKEELVGRYTTFLEIVVIIMRRKTFLYMVQDVLGSDKESNSFQSMEQRRVLAR